MHEKQQHQQASLAAERELDKVIAVIEYSHDIRRVDCATQSIIQTGNVHIKAYLLLHKLSKAMLYNTSKITPLYTMAAIFALHGLLAKDQVIALLTFTPAIENNDLGNYGKSQLMYCAYRVGLSQEAEPAMMAILDLRDASAQAHQRALWTYGCVLGTLHTDLAMYREEYSLADDGMKLASLLEDGQKYQRSLFSLVNAESVLRGGQHCLDAFSGMRHQRERGVSGLGSAIQQLLILYSARDACARGNFSLAQRHLHTAREEAGRFAPIVTAFYMIEQGRLALSTQQDKQSRDHIAEALDFLSFHPNTLNYRVLAQLNCQLQTPFDLAAQGKQHGDKLKKSVVRLTYAYRQSWRSAKYRGYLNS